VGRQRRGDCLIPGTLSAFNRHGLIRRIEVALPRKFIDSDGIHWQVYELSDDGTDGHAHAGWLYFFSRGVTRSLSTYPDDWAMMDWPGLERLCRHARPPARRTSKLPLTTVEQGAEL
jgi:hypothetical protein